MPELRFSRAEFRIETLSISYGIADAALGLKLQGCRIPPGTRLGDSRELHPDISAQGKNTWHIKGPKENGVLMRRALGTETLCHLEAAPGAATRVTCELTCFARHIVYELAGTEGWDISVTEARVLEAFFNRCLNVRDGIVTLSRASVSTRSVAL